MLQLNSKNIPYQSVQVFLSLVSKSSDIATAVLVFTIIEPTRSAFSGLDILNALPPLKPNQPIQRSIPPRVTKGILDAGIALTCPS